MKMSEETRTREEKAKESAGLKVILLNNDTC